MRPGSGRVLCRADSVDSFGQIEVELGDAPGRVGGESVRHVTPREGHIGMMIDLLGVKHRLHYVRDGRWHAGQRELLLQRSIDEVPTLGGTRRDFALAQYGLVRHDSSYR